jgi:hypothetical protein
LSRVRGLRQRFFLLAFAFAFTLVLCSPAWADPQWNAAQNVSPVSLQSSEPQVGVDQYGNAVAVWTQKDVSGNNRIAAAYRPSGLTGLFGAVQQYVSAAGQNASEPQIAVDPAGNAVAVWSRFDGTMLRIQAAYRPAGAASTFGAAQDLSDTLGEAFSPQVGISDSGEAVAIWTRKDGTNYRVQTAVRPAGGASTFGAATTLSASLQDAFEPAIGVAPDGSAVAAWYRSDGLHLRIQASTRPAAGSFGAVQTVSPITEDTFTPQVAVENGGVATLVWYGSDGIQKLRIESASQPSGGSFGSVQTVSDTSQDSFSPGVDSDPTGTAVVIFDHFDGTNNRIQDAVKPPAGTFGSPQYLSAAGQESADPQVDVNSNGDALAIWSRFDGSKSRIQAVPRPSGGSFGLVETISPVSDSFKPQVDQSNANAVAVWYRGDLRIQDAPREPYDVPRSAARLYVSLVPTFRQTISATQCTARGGAVSMHGAPLALTSCNPPAFQPGTQAQFGPKSRGFVKYAGVGGDVSVVSSLTDLQNLAHSDYDPNGAGPDITIDGKLRITDHLNTTPGKDCSPSCHATVADLNLDVPVNCLATADPGLGSNCSVITTLDSLTPGEITSGQQADLQLFRIGLNDSGANGIRGDADDRIFGQSGIYLR